MRRKGMERVTAGVLAAVMAVGMTGCANSGMSGTTTDLTGQYGTKEEGQTEGTGANGLTGQAEDTGTEDTAMEEKDFGAIREAFEDSYTQFSLNLLRESRKQVQNGEGAKNTMVCPLSVMMALEMADRSGRRHEAADGRGFVPGNVGGGWQHGAWQDLQESAGCRGRQIPQVRFSVGEDGGRCVCAG